MKKHFKKFLTLIVALVVVLSAVPVSAKTVTETMAKEYVYLQPRIGCSKIVGSFHPKQKVKFAYNKKIGKVKTTRKDLYGYYWYSFYPTKAGKTTVTTTYLNSYDSYKTTFKEIDKYPFIILNYQNPVSSSKLGNTRISGSRFNKTDKIYMSYNAYSKKNQTFKLTPKKGWIVDRVQIKDKKGFVTKSFYAAYGDYKHAGKFTSAKVRATGGKGNYILSIYTRNQKTNACVETQIVFK